MRAALTADTIGVFMANWTSTLIAVERDPVNFDLKGTVQFTSDDATPRTFTRICNATDLTIERAAVWSQTLITSVLQPSDNGLAALQVAVGAVLLVNPLVAARQKEQQAYKTALDNAQAVNTLKDAGVDVSDAVMVAATKNLSDAKASYRSASDALAVLTPAKPS